MASGQGRRSINFRCHYQGLGRHVRDAAAMMKRQVCFAHATGYSQGDELMYPPRVHACSNISLSLGAANSAAAVRVEAAPARLRHARRSRAAARRHDIAVGRELTAAIFRRWASRVNGRP